MSKIRKSFLKLLVFLSLAFSNYSFCAEEKIEVEEKLEKKEEVRTFSTHPDYSFVIDKLLGQKQAYDKSGSLKSEIIKEVIFLAIASSCGAAPVLFRHVFLEELREDAARGNISPNWPKKICDKPILAVASGVVAFLVVYCLLKFGWKVTSDLWDFITCNKGKEITNLTLLNNFVKDWKINKISTPKGLHDFFEELCSMHRKNGGKLKLSEVESKNMVREVIKTIVQNVQDKLNVSSAPVLS